MSITYDGTGGLFTRVGRLGGAILAVNDFRGVADLSAASIDSVGNAVDEIRDEYAASRSDLIKTLYDSRDSYRGVHSAFITAMKSIAENTIIQQVNDDVKLPALTLSTALTELIRQMVADSESVDANTVSASVAAGSANTGNSSVVVSLISGYGKTLEYVYDEDVVLRCTADSKTGGATEYRETFTASGEAAQSDKLSWDWPKGSATNKTLVSVDAEEDAGSNKLTNSAWGTFTVANTPDSWSILVGSAGTDILEETSVVFRTGEKALKIACDGATLTSIAQTFNSGSGTNTTLSPNTVYAFNFWGRKTTSLAAGVLSVELVDGSNVVIADDAGTNNATTFTLSGWTTSYVAKNGFFRTPKVLPTTYKMRIRLTTAGTNSESFYIADLALTPATQLYIGGPFVAVFGGSTSPVAASGTNAADKWTISVVNNYGGAFQQMFWRMFDMPNLGTIGLILPSNAGGSETIDDALVSAV